MIQYKINIWYRKMLEENFKKFQVFKKKWSVRIKYNKDRLVEINNSNINCFEVILFEW